LQAVGQLALVEAPLPAIRDDQLLIRTGAATICTSDLNDLRANPFHIPLPVILGHEGAGTVAAVGATVRGFQVGDPVAAHPVHPCGRCAICQDGLGHLCPHMEHFGLNLPGTLAEYFVVRADRARRLPAGTDFALAALAEPICVSLEALAQARPSAGQSLLILGDGPFGIMMARLAQALGLRRLVIAGHQPYRLGFARGAVAVNVAEAADPGGALRRAGGEGGYDAVILAVASEAALHTGLACLKPRGRLVVFASLHGPTPVDLFAVQMRELEIVGAVNDADRLDEAIRILAEGRPPLADLVTHRFDLADYEAAFELAAHGQHAAVKIAFVF
jgi:threonine dehydrogenase-like Zn-dependent dehydrogenase